MKTLCIVSPFAFLLLVSGCGTINHAQYQITGPSRADNVHAAVSADERERVRVMLTTIAARFKLQDFTESGLIPNVIVYFQEQDSQNPLHRSRRHTAQRTTRALFRQSLLGGFGENSG